MFILATAFKNSPSIKIMPVGIRDEAIPLWKSIIKKYRKTILYQDTLEKQWAVAVILLKRACLARSVIPFNVQTLQKQKEETIEKIKPDSAIYEKTRKSVKESKTFIKQLLNILCYDGLLDSTLKSQWVYDRAVYFSGKYHIATYMRLKFGKGKTLTDFTKDLIHKHKFSKQNSTLIYYLDDITAITFEVDKHKPSDSSAQNIIYIYRTYSYTMRQAEVLTARDPSRKLVNRLNNVGRDLIL